MERELAELFKDTNLKAHVYRPGYFFPSKDYPEDRLNQRGVERALDIVATPLFKYTPWYSPIEDFGRFAVEVVKGRWPEQELFRNTDMRKLVKEVPPRRDEL